MPSMSEINVVKNQCFSREKRLSNHGAISEKLGHGCSFKIATASTVELLNWDESSSITC